jgi:hypothetical protein
LAQFVVVRVGVGYEHPVAFFRTRRDADHARSSLAARHRGTVGYEVRAATREQPV